MDNKQVRKSLIIFSFISIGCGWLGVLVDTLLTEQPEGNSLGMLLWLIIPFFTAIILRFSIKNGSNVLGLKLKLKGNGTIYLIAILIIPVITILTLSLGFITNWISFQGFSTKHFIGSFIGIFIYYIFKNILEELAWRGFLTERLLKLNIKGWKIYIIVSLVWGTWHIPYYLFFLKLDKPLVAIITNYLVLFCWIILYTELYKKSRTIWPCVILHAFSNSIYILNEYIKLDYGKGWVLSIDSGIISLAIFVIIGLMLRKSNSRTCNQ